MIFLILKCRKQIFIIPKGLGWPLALFTIIIPVRMVATLIRQISMSKLAPVMFEANLAQTFNELKLDAFGASQNRYMLKHLGQRNAPKNAGLPQAYHQARAFEDYCDKHCGINFRFWLEPHIPLYIFT